MQRDARRREKTARGMGFLTIFCVLAACSSERPPARGNVAARGSEGQVAPPAPSATVGSPLRAEPERHMPAPYPLGRWRLVTFEQLKSVVLPLSHLLIRHNRVGEQAISPNQVSFKFHEWRTEVPAATRSWEEARALAERLAEQAEQAPERFPELARQFSEDPVTRDRGGALGAMAASDLIFWPWVLDALAATKVGAVTRVLETEYGFHVLRREAPPKERTLSGAHIVIVHVDAPFVQLVAGGKVPTRPRAEAFALAQQVYELARTRPGDFERLVQEYSGHEDAERAGDFGTWSTWEPTPLSREVATLQELEVGQVAAPIDTLFGFQIILRTKNRPRPEYAMDEIQIEFDPLRPASDSASKASRLSLAQQTVRQLIEAPGRFAEMQAKYCCRDAVPVRWIDGRDTPAIATALAGLKPGQIALLPIESNLRYSIVKRLEPSSLRKPSATVFELPAPKDIRLEDMIIEQGSAFTATQLEAAISRTVSALQLGTEVRDALEQQQQELSRRFKAAETLEEALSAATAFGKSQKAALKPAEYAQYQAFVREQFERAVLNPGPEAAAAKLPR
jgi:hypothetical protein